MRVNSSRLEFGGKRWQNGEPAGTVTWGLFSDLKHIVYGG